MSASRLPETKELFLEEQNLQAFDKVWKKSLTHIVTDFAEKKPSAYAELHLRVKRKNPEDRAVIAELYSALPELSSLRKVLHYYFDLDKKAGNPSEEIQASLLSDCLRIYDNRQVSIVEKIEKTPGLKQLIMKGSPEKVDIEELRVLAQTIRPDLFCTSDEIEPSEEKIQEINTFLAGLSFEICSVANDLEKLEQLQENKSEEESDVEFYEQANMTKAIDPWGLHMASEYEQFHRHYDAQNRQFVITHNPNYFYLLGLQQEIDRFCYSSAFNIFDLKQKNSIELPPAESTCFNRDDRFDPVGPQYLQALENYRNAVCLGFDVALTGLARIYARNTGGVVQQNTEFALQLYKNAFNREVVGGLPLDNGDSRILFYSVMTSGLHVIQGADDFRLRTPLRGVAFIEIEWLMQMNYADESLGSTLSKFRDFAINNPDNQFDALLKEHTDALDRLRNCLDEEAYEAVRERVLSRETLVEIPANYAVGGSAMFSPRRPQGQGSSVSFAQEENRLITNRKQ